MILISWAVCPVASWWSTDRLGPRPPCPREDRHAKTQVQLRGTKQRHHLRTTRLKTVINLGRLLLFPLLASEIIYRTELSEISTMAPQSFRSILGMPANTASTSDSALVIIDAQNEYASGALTVTNAAASGKVIANLLEKYRSANGKVIHVLHKTPEGAPIFTPGTELANEFKDLKAKV
jgi:hypothetical protein